MRGARRGRVAAGPWLLDLLYGSQYAGAAAPFQILAVAVLFTFVNYALTHFVIAHDLHRRYLAYTATVFVLNLVLCLVLVSRFGPVGAAWSVVLSEALLLILCWRALPRVPRRGAALVGGPALGGPGRRGRPGDEWPLWGYKGNMMTRPTGTPRLRTRALDACGLAALGLLAALLPFELTQPALSVGPIGVTNVELALYLVLMVWATIWLRGPRSAWTWVHSAVAAWLAVGLLAALLAPTGRGEALKFALRTLGGGALFYATLDLVSTRRQITWIALAICAGAVLSATAGVAEVWLPAVRGGLEAFKTQASFAGGFLRASGTFQYANTAGMYWEAVVPLTLALGVCAVARVPSHGRLWPASRWLATAATVVLVQAVVLTASRAAWWAVAGLLTVLLVAGVRLCRPLRGPVVVVCLALMLFTGSGWGGNGLLALRLLAGNEATWLSAAFAAPPTTLTIPAGTVTTVPMTVRNTGLRDWPRLGNTPVHLSYHWVAPDGVEVLLWDGARTRLPHTVAAGDTVTLPALIDGNVPPGRYRLQWDLVQEQIAWFSILGAPTAPIVTTWVDVEQRDDAPVIAELPPPITLIHRARAKCGPSARCSGSVRTNSGTRSAPTSISPPSTTGRTPAACLSKPSSGKGSSVCSPSWCCSRPSRGRSSVAGIGSTDWHRGSSGSAWRWEC